ncbi:hypothetical protein KAJ87_01610 [Candidatus Pacearchaeota archaeon]|nr:hypothetical protein [Candidatus Pacearchaeota archaeon]
MGRIKRRRPHHQVNKKEIMVKRKLLNKVEKLILNTLFKEDIPLTPNALATITGLAYVTAKKYLIQMTKEGLLVEAEKKKAMKKEKGKRGESRKYMINTDIWC